MKQTLDNSQPILKRLYPNGVEEVLYKESRLFELCKKDTTFFGEDAAVVVRISGTNGQSPNFADALASQGASTKVRFIVNRKKEYHIYSIDGEAIAATGSDKGAIVKVIKDENKEAMYKFGRRMQKLAAGKGGGSIGTIHASTNLATTTLLLGSRLDVQWLEIGDYVQFAQNDGSSPSASQADLRGSGASLRVVSIDREASPVEVVMSAALNTVTGITVGDNIFVRGSYARTMTGLRGWLPEVAPSPAENFMGVDRTDYDLIRVAGYRYVSNGGGSYQDILLRGCAEAANHGITVNTLFMGSIDFAEFILEIGAQRLRDSKDSKVGYQFIEIYTPCAEGGVLKVVHDAAIPTGYGWAFRKEDFVLATAGPCPSMLDHGGLGGKGLLMPADDDALQGRLGCYGNFKFMNPGNAVIFQFTA